MGEQHHVHRLRSRSRLAPAGACPSATTPSPVVLAEVPTGVPSPFVPPRGSWRTPAAAPVKGRSRSLVCRRTPLTNIGRSSHTPWRAVIGGQGLSTLSGLASGASRPSLGRGARPSFARPAHGHTLPAEGLNHSKTRDQDPAIRTTSGRQGHFARPRHARGAVAGSPTRRVVLFSCQSSCAAGAALNSALRVPLPSCPGPIRLAARASSVGAQLRPRRTLPRKIAIACDVSVDRHRKLLEIRCEPSISGDLAEELGVIALIIRLAQPPRHRPATSPSAPRASNYSSLTALRWPFFPTHARTPSPGQSHAPTKTRDQDPPIRTTSGRQAHKPGPCNFRGGVAQLFISQHPSSLHCNEPTQERLP